MAKHSDDKQQWFLRTNGETVFGPVTTQELIRWAEQGRVLPGHEVSSDSVNWESATTQAMLEMRWFVDDTEGELRGPLNRLAAESLIASGKVPPGSRLVEENHVDDIMLVAEEEVSVATPPPAMPQEILHRRIRELEAIVSEQRTRLVRITEGSAAEVLLQERDKLDDKLKQSEEQCSTLVAEMEEATREQERNRRKTQQLIKELEQRCESAEAEIVSLRSASEVREQELLAKNKEQAELLQQQTFSLQQAQEEHSTVLSAETNTLQQKLEAVEQVLAERTGELKQRIAELSHSLEQSRSGHTALQSALDTARKSLQQSTAALSESEERMKAAEIRANTSEKALAELLTDSNKRDQEYKNQIERLELDSAQTPEERARFSADQAAVYELVKAEINDLAESIEEERAQSERVRTLSLERQKKLLERRQRLLKHLGATPEEMLRRVGREQPSDALTARLRADLENLRVTYQREVKFFEQKDREYKERIRFLESEASKLRVHGLDAEKNSGRIEEERALNQQLQQELHEERIQREAERDQFLANQAALLARIEHLEKHPRNSMMAPQPQPAPKPSSKLSSWMQFK